MRHALARIVTFGIAGALILGAAIFAWLRSTQLTLTDEATVIERFEPTDIAGFRWAELGQMSYARNCTNCHLADGSGWDQYPAIDVAAVLAVLPGGREYLIDLHLYGVTSRRWGAPMPRMHHLQDAEIAAVLNHVLTAFGMIEDEGVLFGPEEIAARRGLRLSPGEVHERRPASAEPPR